MNNLLTPITSIGIESIGIFENQRIVTVFIVTALALLWLLYERSLKKRTLSALNAVTLDCVNTLQNQNVFPQGEIKSFQYIDYTSNNVNGVYEMQYIAVFQIASNETKHAVKLNYSTQHASDELIEVHASAYSDVMVIKNKGVLNVTEYIPIGDYTVQLHLKN